jgi:hypothetical protein
MLTPVSLLGHRITFYGWGWQVRLRGGYLVKSKGAVYFSHNGTSDDATVWFRGTPRPVVAAAEKHAQEQAERHAAYRNEASNAS